MSAYLDQLRSRGLDAAIAEVGRLQAVIAQERRLRDRMVSNELYCEAHRAWIAAGKPTF